MDSWLPPSQYEEAMKKQTTPKASNSPLRVFPAVTKDTMGAKNVPASFFFLRPDNPSVQPARSDLSNFITLSIRLKTTVEAAIRPYINGQSLSSTSSVGKLP